MLKTVSKPGDFLDPQYLAVDFIDMVAVQQLGCEWHRDVLASGVVVFLFVAQLG